MVINSYVLDENFVWYLYNFLEKTDGVGILIDNLTSDLFSKAQGTVAFDGLLKHLVDNYQLSSDQDPAYLNNAVIENFYHKSPAIIQLLCNLNALFWSESNALISQLYRKMTSKDYSLNAKTLQQEGNREHQEFCNHVRDFFSDLELRF
jgi:hypothetical protein